MCRKKHKAVPGPGGTSGGTFRQVSLPGTGFPARWLINTARHEAPDNILKVYVSFWLASKWSGSWLDYFTCINHLRYLNKTPAAVLGV